MDNFAAPLVAVLIIGGLISTPPARAQLRWETTSIEQSPGVDETETVARYPFKNAGNHRVAISRVETSCSCTKAKADQATYAPGESGRIVANYELPALSGPQRKGMEILVTTDDKSTPPTKLQLFIHLPAILRVTPSSLSWTIGEAPCSKTLTLDVSSRNDVNIAEVHWGAPKSHFDARWEAIVPGRKYLVTVAPRDGARAEAVDMLLVETDYPPQRHLIVPAVVMITPGLAGRAH